MKKKQSKPKKENKQVVEIHIYIHQTGTNIWPNTTPPYYVTCQTS